MLLREGDEIPVEIERGHIGGRVRRIADDQRDGLRDRMGDRPLGGRKERRRRLGGNRANDAAGHQEAEGVDRIAGVRHQHHVARRGDGLRHVGEAFLRAERRDHLRIGIELHAEAALVIAGLGATQAGDALGRGIAVGAGFSHRLDKLVDDVLGGLQVRIAHAEIDDVGAPCPCRCLDAIELLENVRRQDA